jgi:phosphopantothenoylcysteine decarboxylase/phosphopantothenate--cysteine ligase
VRYLSNPSSGKMGLALASVARALGAQVTVVLGPTSEQPADDLEVVPVTSAQQMLDAVLARVDAADYFVAAAAVSDFRPAEVAAHKVKKAEAADSVKLVRTPDVLLTASQRVHAAARRPVLVGFAAETKDVIVYAKQKLAEKKLDFVVANDVSEAGAGFGGDTNRVQILSAKGAAVEAQGEKREVARRVWDVVLSGK